MDITKISGNRSKNTHGATSKKKKKKNTRTHTQLCCVCATKDSINRVNGKTTKEEKIFPNYIYDKKLIFKIYKMELLKKKFPNNLIFKKELRT